MDSGSPDINGLKIPRDYNNIVMEVTDYELSNNRI